MGSVVLSHVSLLISILRLNLVLTYGVPPDMRSQLDQQVKKLDEMAEKVRVMDQRVSSLEQDTR